MLIHHRRAYAAFMAIAVLLPMALASMASASGPVGDVTTATVPSSPIPSGIAGAGYYSARSTVTVTNETTTAQPASSVTISLPRATHSAAFAVDHSKSETCTATVTSTMRNATCAVEALAPGATATIATIVGSENATTGLPTSVSATILGPDLTPLVRTWTWALPYSHLVASFGPVTSPVDYGAAATTQLTITNTGIWPSAPDTITISGTPAVSGGWFSWSPSVVGTYCGVQWGPSNAIASVCPVGAIAVGGSITINVSVSPLVAGSFAFTAADGTGQVAATSAPVAIVGTGANLAFSVANASSVEAGSTFTRTYTVTNTGSTEALNVSLYDTAAAFLVPSSSGDGTCQYFSAYRVGGRINCSFGTLAPGQSKSIVATLLAPLTGRSAVPYTSAIFGSTTSATVTGDSLTAEASVSVYALPPAVSIAPTLTGSPTVGGTVTATFGSWSGTGPISLFAKLCHTTSIGCASDISSTYATATVTPNGPSQLAITYPVTSADVGTSLVLVVEAQNPSGSVSLFTSTPLGPVS